MNIKSIFPVFFIVFIIFSKSNIVFSQDSSSVIFPKECALKKGNYALVFELSTAFGFSNFFEPFTLTAKKHLSDNLAVRLSFGANYSKLTGDEQKLVFDNKLLSLAYINPSYFFQTSINLQYFPSVKTIVKPFISLGPLAEYTYSEASHTTDYQKSESWGIGLFSSFGLEIFPFANVSFIGEYIFKATWGKSLSKQISYDSNSNIQQETYNYLKRVDIKFKTARMGFSVYF